MEVSLQRSLLRFELRWSEFNESVAHIVLCFPVAAYEHLPIICINSMEVSKLTVEFIKPIYLYMKGWYGVGGP